MELLEIFSIHTNSETLTLTIQHQITHSCGNKMEGRQVLAEAARLHETVTYPFKNKHQVERDVLEAWGKLRACFTSHCSARVTS